MAFQRLPPEENWVSGLSEALGTGLGAGLERYQQSKGLQALGQLSGREVSPQLASQLAGLNPQILSSVLKNLTTPNKQILASYQQMQKEIPYLQRMKELTTKGKAGRKWGMGDEDTAEYEALLQGLLTTSPQYKSLKEGLAANIPQNARLELLDQLIGGHATALQGMPGMGQLFRQPGVQPGVQPPGVPGVPEGEQPPPGEVPFAEERDPIMEAAKGLPSAVVRGLGGVGATLAGMPGKFLERYHSSDVDALEQVAKMTGEPFDRKEMERLHEASQKLGRLGGLKVPTPEDIQKGVVTPVVRKVFGEKYVRPQNDIDAAVEELTADVAYLMMPGLAPMRWQKALLTAGLGGTSKLLAKKAGVGPLGQEVAKLGGMFSSNIANLARPGAYSNHASELYGTAEEALASKPTVNYNKIKPMVDYAQKKTVSALLPAKVKDSVNALVEEAFTPVAGKKVATTEMKDVIELLHTVNDHLFGKGAAVGTTKAALKAVKSDIYSIIKNYGETNKAFQVPFQQAQNLHKTISTATKLSDFFSSYRSLGSALFKSGNGLGAGASILLGWLARTATGLKGHLPLIGFSAGAAFPLHAISFVKHMAKDPTARSLMYQLAKAGVAEKANLVIPLTNKLIKHLDKVSPPKD